MKFEEAYNSFEKRTIPIYEVNELYLKDKTVFINFYKEHFYCPECRIAKLSFVNNSKPYFRTHLSYQHSDNCSLAQQYNHIENAEKLLSEYSNKDTISRQVQNLMNILLDEKIKTNNEITKHSNKLKTSSIIISNTNKFNTKQLPRKRIDTPFVKDDFNCYKFFYGNVYISWEYNKIYGYHQFIIRSIKDKKFICRIKITDKVLSYIPKHYIPKKSCNCKIVFLSSIQKDKKGYKKTTLQRSDFIAIEY